MRILLLNIFLLLFISYDVFCQNIVKVAISVDSEYALRGVKERYTKFTTGEPTNLVHFFHNSVLLTDGVTENVDFRLG